VNPEAKILIGNPSYCIATWDRVLLQMWRLEVTDDPVNNLEKLGRAFIRDNRENLCSLSIVEATSPPPNDKLRSALAAAYREFAPRMNEQILVAEGSGFRMALVRSVGLALNALAPQSLPFKFVSKIEDAAKLIAPHLSPTSGGAAGLLDAIKAVRLRKDPRL
jgi:hypothetical protein